MHGSDVFKKEWTIGEGFAQIEPQNKTVFSLTNSCMFCHNRPFGTAGVGGITPDDGGLGRKVPGLFGVGAIEAISETIRVNILQKYGDIRLGYIPKDRLNGARVIIQAAGGYEVDFGSLSVRSDGKLDFILFSSHGSLIVTDMHFHPFLNRELARC